MFLTKCFYFICSTISSTLNSMAAMTWEDLLKWKFYYLSEKAQTTINKVIGKMNLNDYTYYDDSRIKLSVCLNNDLVLIGRESNGVP